MNILFLNSARRGWGGNEKSIQLLASALAEEHTVILGYKSELVGSKFAITCYKLPFLHEADLYTIIALIRIVRKHRIDVIIPTKRKEYVLGGIVARLCGIKNILWLGANRPLKNNHLHNLIYNRLASGIIVNAHQIRNTLLQAPFMQEPNIRVIYNGIDTRLLDASLREHKAERPRPEFSPVLTITAMGRLDRNKGFDFLLRSFEAFIRTTQRPAQLVIIGDGPLKNEYQQLALQLGISGQITFTGFLQDPYRHLISSDIFASTSISEGLSIALLEAMYLGNAPVSTLAGGGVTEIIHDGINGFLLNYGDQSTLVSILQKLSDNPGLLETMSQKASETVAERYCMQKIIAEIIDFCRTCPQ